MKTRIVHTRIWEDEWFCSLSNDAQKLFLYLITNQRINICGMYRITDRVIYFDTKIRLEKLERVKNELSAVGKVSFFDEWVYIKNAQRLGGYTGEKNNEAAKKEMAEVPENIKKCFLKGICDRVSEKGDRVLGLSAEPDSPINHKSEIINNKLKTKEGEIEKKSGEENQESPEVMKKRFTLSDDQLEELKKQFPFIEVELEYNKAKDYLLSNGGKRKGNKPVKDYMAFLRNWMRSDWAKKKPFVPPATKQNDSEIKISEEQRKNNLVKMAEMGSQLKKKMIIKK